MSSLEPKGDASSISGRLLCPDCGKRYDNQIEKSPVLSCPHCGVQFKTQHGADRRRDERIKKEIVTVLEHDGQCLESRSKDLSKGGLCVMTSGELPVATGDTLGLFVGQHRFLARVMWVNKLYDAYTVGLQWRSRFMNRIKEAFFSAASVGALFYLVFMFLLIGLMFYFAFLR